MTGKIRLGDKVKCKYTGYQGIAVAKTEFINGCIQFSVAQKFDKKAINTEAQFSEISIDEGSLEIVDKKLRKYSKKEIKQAEETMNVLDEDEEESGGPSTCIVCKQNSIKRRRNY